MAEIAGIFAASHTPVMLNFPDAIPAADRDAVFGAFRDLGRRIAAVAPQALVVISDDHLHNFFLDNFPAVCIGAARSYQAPMEHWLRAEPRTVPGDVALGSYLVQAALEADFDPSFSMELGLDHGILTPLELAGIERTLPVVPILVNCVQPPMPTMRRCFAWGTFLGRALRAYSGVERVAILATGGLSHDLSTPRMGMVNEAFDAEFLRLIAGDDVEALLAHARGRVAEAGNGAEEIRTWLMAKGAADGAPFDAYFYKAIADWYTGIAIGAWRAA